MTKGGAAAGATSGSSSVGPDDVARYYDRNTGRFMLLGRGGVHAIHRELWGAGVTTSREAADHVNRLLAAELADLATAPSPLVLDFGCGVGGTLFRLAEWLPQARFHGITVSRRQRDVAVRLAEQLGWAERCSFTHGDFHTADVGARADAIVAVESFAHSGSPGAFLANAWRHLEPGGRLLLADDFLARDEGSLDDAQRRAVDRFRTGWRVPGVGTVERLVRDAAERGLGLEKDVDLTPLTRPGSRLRDRAVALTSPAFARLGLAGIPFFGNLIGGHALQAGLRDGFLQYRLLIFRKVARDALR